MRIAILSDVHANLLALEAVLSDMRMDSKPDKIVLLGDVASEGPKPRQTVERLMELGIPTVQGNTDDLDRPSSSSPTGDEQAQKINQLTAWCFSQLSDEQKSYLRTFRKTIEIPLGKTGKMLCYHGSPKYYEDEILPTTPERDLDAFLAGHDGVNVFAGGHTHEQMFRRFKNKIVINPGSVGLPFEVSLQGASRNPPWSEYAIVRVENDEEEGVDLSSIGVELKRVSLRLVAIRQQILNSGMPYAEWFASDWK